MNFINSVNVATDFKPGDSVRYVPTHAIADYLENKSHPDTEDGVVSLVNAYNVFVKYCRHGVLQQTAQSTDPRDLIKL